MPPRLRGVDRRPFAAPGASPPRSRSACRRAAARSIRLTRPAEARHHGAVRRRKDRDQPEPTGRDLVPSAPPPPPAPDDRAWSSRRNVGEREARTDLVPFMALPAETGPTWAPDRLSIWPVEGGRFGIDAHYHGASGRARAAQQAGRLERVNLAVSVRDADGGGATLRLGPLAHQAVWLAIEAFLGRPLAGEE